MTDAPVDPVEEELKRCALWHDRLVREREERERRLAGKPLQAALKRLMKTLDVPGRKKTDRWVTLWAEAVGSELAGQTRVMTFKNGILTIRVPNAALKSELETFHKQALLHTLQDKCEGTILRDLSFRM